MQTLGKVETDWNWNLDDERSETISVKLGDRKHCSARHSRHAAACEPLASKVDLNTIRAVLCRASLDTTNICVEIDIWVKARAMDICEAVEPGTDCLRK